MIGPGKYDDICTQVREATKAEGIVLIVINGEHGGGFSVQAPLVYHLRLPELLRNVADEIERAGCV